MDNIAHDIDQLDVHPCIFCGSVELLLITRLASEINTKKHEWTVHCTRCRAKGPVATNRQQAAFLWNGRSS